MHYLAEIEEGDPTPNTEIEEVRWFGIDDLPANVFDNVVKVIEEIKANPI